MDLRPRRLADTVMLRPAGRIDQASADAFRDALQPFMERCAPGGDRVILDLSGLVYVSSAGLRVLMLARKQAKSQGGTLVLAALQPLVREIFEISRFTVIFDVFPSVRDALARVSPAGLAAFDAG